jgi:ankyrin repeat protein
MLSFGEKKLQELNEESGETTWHVIAKNGDIEIIQKKYFDLDEREINFKNKEGLTPFAIAIEKNNLEMVKELTKCGAKNSKEDILNFIATAIKNTNSEMYIFLISFFNASDYLNLENKGEKVSHHVARMREGEGRSVTDAPSYKPSGARNISVTALLNHEEVASKNGSGSRS